MARIRTLKPEILEDEKTAALSDAAFRLFIAMIILADDHGNVRADGRWLTGQVWWTRGEPPRIAEFLREIRRADLVEFYEVRGGVYAHLRGWSKHQRIDNAGKPRVPLPNDSDAIAYLDPQDVDNRGSRNFAAKRGEIPLDPDPDQDPERDQDLDAAAKSPLAELDSKLSKAARLPRRCSIPENWEPRAEERAMAEQSRLNVGCEANAFRDHHAAKGSRMLDWDAAFRTWLRNAVKFGGARGGARQPTPLEQQMERVAELERLEREAKGGS